MCICLKEWPSVAATKLIKSIKCSARTSPQFSLSAVCVFQTKQQACLLVWTLNDHTLSSCLLFFTLRCPCWLCAGEWTQSCTRSAGDLGCAAFQGSCQDQEFFFFSSSWRPEWHSPSMHKNLIWIKYDISFSISICAVWHILIQQWNMLFAHWHRGKMRLFDFFLLDIFTGVQISSDTASKAYFPHPPQKTKTILTCLLEYMLPFCCQAETGNVLPEKKNGFTVSELSFSVLHRRCWSNMQQPFLNKSDTSFSCSGPTRF